MSEVRRFRREEGMRRRARVRGEERRMRGRVAFMWVG